MVQLTDKHWAVEVPDDADGIQLSDETQDHDNAEQWILFYLKDGNLQPLKSLPPVSWQYLFTTKGVTEEDASKVVEQRGKSYRDYERTFNFIPLSVFTAIESLQSLLRSKGCDMNKNFAIIQNL